MSQLGSGAPSLGQPVMVARQIEPSQETEMAPRWTCCSATGANPSTLTSLAPASLECGAKALPSNPPGHMPRWGMWSPIPNGELHMYVITAKRVFSYHEWSCPDLASIRTPEAVKALYAMQ